MKVFVYKKEKVVIESHTRNIFCHLPKTIPYFILSMLSKIPMLLSYDGWDWNNLILF